MRIGVNPGKFDQKVSQAFYHRVIIPVYIPNLDGYFKDALKILDLCLSSLYLTVNSNAAITVIDNACCPEAKAYLANQFTAGVIDQLVVNKINLGKVDPLISVIRGSHEELVTITDADVLFKNGWLRAVEEIFTHFPKAGMVSPSPGPLGFQNYCTSVIWDNIFSSSLQFRSLTNRRDMELFLHSIGNPGMYNENHYAFQLSLKNDTVHAVIGCGHYVVSCRRCVFDYAPRQPSRFLLDMSSDNNYIDKPNDEGGFWKLSTVQNLTYHMGNTPEPWMDEYFGAIREERTAGAFQLPVHKPAHLIPYRVRNKFVNAIFKHKGLRSFFFKRWGATFPADQY